MPISAHPAGTYYIKGRLRHPKRQPFTPQKDTFCNPKRGLLQHTGYQRFMTPTKRRPTKCRPTRRNTQKKRRKAITFPPLKSGLLDSNQRPLRPERSALPTALNPDLRVQRYCKRTTKNAYLCTRKKQNDGAIAQLVEQRTENPCVPGSIPGGTTLKIRELQMRSSLFLLFYPLF